MITRLRRKNHGVYYSRFRAFRWSGVSFKRLQRRANVLLALAVLIVGLLPAIPVEAAISQVQTPATGTCGGSGSCNATATITSATANNLLIAVCGGASSSAPTYTVTGFTSAVGSATTGSTSSTEIFYKVAAGSETSITCALTGSGTIRGMITVFEYSGTATTNVVNATATGSGSGSTSFSTSNLSTSVSNTLLIAGVTKQAGTSFSTWNNSFTEESDHTSGPGTVRTQGTASRIVASTGSYGVSGNTASSSAAYAAQLVAFSDSSGALTHERLTQRAFIWENDDEDQADGDVVDENSQLAAGDTAISGVVPGEQLTLRLHLENTGDGPAGSNLGLFYDRNDGLWSRVKTSAIRPVAGSGCTDASWTCTDVETTDDNGKHSSIAIGDDGRVWVSYFDDTNDDLIVAEYVGSGGSGCASTAWSCVAVVTSGAVGEYSSITIHDGDPWVAYYDGSGSGDVAVARFVGGATGTGCANNNWTCSTINGAGTSAGSVSIASNGIAMWLSYYSATAADLVAAEYVGDASGSCTDTDWDCTTVISTNDVGSFSDIVIDDQNEPWISYHDNTNNDLEVAEYVGGTSGTGCASNAWTCTDVITSGDVGEYTSIAAGPDGDMWIAYHDAGNNDLEVAEHVGGSSGSCTGTGAWNCTTILSTNDVGSYNSLSFAPDGSAWITHLDDTGDDLELARHVGSGGSGCGSSAWTCETLQSTGQVGQYNAVAFDRDGLAYVSTYDFGNGDVEIAHFNRSGDMLIGTSKAAAQGDGLNESHTDMTSVTDTTGRDDADCETGGASWNNGEFFESEVGTVSMLGIGDSTTQCTEIAWVIDTSQAQPSTTYRFVVATEDGVHPAKGIWRGPISVAQYAELSTGDTPDFRASKDFSAIVTDCDDTAWGCVIIDNTSSRGSDNSIIVAPDGTVWVAIYDGNSSFRDLIIAEYVGSGGTGCSSGDEWDCTTIDSFGQVGAQPSMAIDRFGRPWVAYAEPDGNALSVARYVGSGNGTGCVDGAWTCEVVDGEASGRHFEHASIAIHGDKVWVSYVDLANDELEYARYVGSGGTGCDSAAWTCESIDDPTNDFASRAGAEMVFDSNGKAWIAHTRSSLNDLYVAEYVGTGGSCDNTAWECTAVDATISVWDNDTRMTIDHSGTPIIAYKESSSNDLWVTRFVGGASGSGCTDADWDCEEVETADAVGEFAIATDASGTPWVAFNNTTDTALTIAERVSGSGCADSGWTCTNIDDSLSTGGGAMDIDFDSLGTPHIIYRDTTSGTSDVKYAKMHYSPTAPNPGILSISDRGVMSGEGTFRLAAGRSPFSSSPGNCSSTSDNEGYCGAYSADGANFDSIANDEPEQTPIYMFSMRYGSNSIAPTPTWHGQTNVAPNTSGDAGDLNLEVYRYGSTNAWESVDTDSTSADCDGENCVLTGKLAGTASEYFDQDGSDYWVYFRVYQEDHTSALTLKTDGFEAPATQQLLRGGRHFINGVTRPLSWTRP